MKLKFKHQPFQADATRAVVDVFKGQPAEGYACGSALFDEALIANIYGNREIVLSDEQILEQIQKIQQKWNLRPSEKIEDCLSGNGEVSHYNLSIEMETGVGKTYTYIKTMFELHKHYGWSKFIVVVPSVAIREGVYKTFQITQEHFAEEYGKKIQFFIYDSRQLSQIKSFAEGNALQAMIINTQAFNARGNDARRIRTERDDFNSRKPIDAIAGVRPILIIDEPQSVEGAATLSGLKEFNPLMILRYSATHRTPYNMIYRLDALDAFNKRLVKKIIVKGIEQVGNDASAGYIYFEKINISKNAPTVTLHFDTQTKTGVKKTVRTLKHGSNLYPQSNELEEYKNNWVISEIDGTKNEISFLNGVKMHAGEVRGNVNEAQLRRLQIRETIISHLERERDLFKKGIKVLSLFFIDEVAKYRCYAADGTQTLGEYARMFEEEYADVLHGMQTELGDRNYQEYLNKIPAGSTHSGYFSIDKKSGKMINSRETANDEKNLDAYDLIMKDKERLLDLDPERSPVRFIFSHSALREGWDNPNVFQICTLKESDATVKKRQEIGRGMRLCVNQAGERMDESVLGSDVHRVNALTVIASESYEKFASALQQEIAEAITSRPRKVDVSLFENQPYNDETGAEQKITHELANKIVYCLTTSTYINSNGTITDKFFADKRNNAFSVPEELAPIKQTILKLLDSVYTPVSIDNGKKNGDVSLKIDEKKLAMREFKTLWGKINAKTVYTVNFDDEELIQKSVAAIDSKLDVPAVYFRVTTGTQAQGNTFVHEEIDTKPVSTIKSNFPYDLVGEIAQQTNLTRKTVVKILKKIAPVKFDLFKKNPEEFIIRVGTLINSEKGAVVVEHIAYDMLDEKFKTNIFTEANRSDWPGSNAIETRKHLFDHLIFDSETERKFAEELEVATNVAVYVKLPSKFYIETPVGKYNPDWAIAFKQGSVRHVYFVAETKGSLDSLELRAIESAKIQCARKHFVAIAKNDVVYDVVSNYQQLLEKIKM